MPKRFVSIWFRYLLTDREAIRQKSLREMPVAFTEPDRGRMLITAMNAHAEDCGVKHGMTAADARVIAPGIQLFDIKPGRNIKLLKGLAEWCLRYTPLVHGRSPGRLIAGRHRLHPPERQRAGIPKRYCRPAQSAWLYHQTRYGRYHRLRLGGCALR